MGRLGKFLALVMVGTLLGGLALIMILSIVSMPYSSEWEKVAGAIGVAILPVGGFVVIAVLVVKNARLF